MNIIQARDNNTQSSWQVISQVCLEWVIELDRAVLSFALLVPEVVEMRL